MSIFKALNPYSLPLSALKKSQLEIQREMVLQHLLNTTAGFGVLGLVLFLLRNPAGQQNLPWNLSLAVLLGILFVCTIARRLPYPLRTGLLVVLLAAVSFLSLLQERLGGTSLIYTVVLIAAVAILFSPRAGIFTIGGVILVQGLIAWLTFSGRLNLTGAQAAANFGLLPGWIDSILAILFSAVSIAGAFFILSHGYSSVESKQTALKEEIQTEHRLLESRVQERTLELSRKTAQLEAARQVGNTMSGAPDTDQLLNTVIKAIQEKFGFYQVNIFLNDERNEYTVLHASTGDVGQKLLEVGYRLKVGETGIVGFVAGKGKHLVARDVEGDPNYISNPALPETRAELAVPLFDKGNIAGVLDVQSNQVNAFLVDDIDIITSLADQLSQAVEKSRQLEDLRHRLNNLENTSLQITQSAWNSHLRTSKRGYAFRYRQARIEKTSSHSPESLQALKQGATVVTSSPAGSQSTQPFATLAIPIKIRNQTLGVINMRVAGGRVSPELIELVEGAVNRLSASLENARLLEEIQARSERERLVGDIASKVRTATDIDSILRTTAGELGRSLGVSEVVIQLNSLK